MTTKTKTKSKSVPELQPNPFMHEILEAVHVQRTVAKKAEVLQKYRTEGLVALLIWNFDDTAVSALPEGTVQTAAPTYRSGRVITVSGRTLAALNGRNPSGGAYMKGLVPKLVSKVTTDTFELPNAG